ncbi:hypothetical protein SAMN05661044_03082 [Olivibacter domesticus]|uniref:Uncharacterized protein n=1 Tax=Olivibacter domesticus TaxID=407022 RepID=A0A1H7S652_OLID1|nr:hypothetical protein SAMN05661044_03082 [Olivibacter domesticus]
MYIKNLTKIQFYNLIFGNYYEVLLCLYQTKGNNFSKRRKDIIQLLLWNCPLSLI